MSICRHPGIFVTVRTVLQRKLLAWLNDGSSYFETLKSTLFLEPQAWWRFATSVKVPEVPGFNSMKIFSDDTKTISANAAVVLTGAVITMAEYRLPTRGMALSAPAMT